MRGRFENAGGGGSTELEIFLFLFRITHLIYFFNLKKKLILNFLLVELLANNYLAKYNN